MTEAADMRLSRSGQALRRLLQDIRPATAVGMLRRPVVTSELATQMLVLSVRRAWVGQAGSGSTGPDLRAMLQRDGSLTPRRLRLAESLCGSFASMATVWPRLPLRDQDIVISLLIGLVQDAHLSGEELSDLIRTAEWRVQRNALTARTRPSWRRRWLRRAARQIAFVPGVEDAGPGTAMGRILEAMMRVDLDAARALPDGGDREGGNAVLGGVLTALIRRQFPTAPQRPEVAGTAARSAARCTSPLISTDDVTDIVLGEFEATDVDLEPQVRLQAELGILMELAEHQGLLLGEIRDLVVAAEEAAIQAFP